MKTSKFTSALATLVTIFCFHQTGCLTETEAPSDRAVEAVVASHEETAPSSAQNTSTAEATASINGLNWRPYDPHPEPCKDHCPKDTWTKCCGLRTTCPQINPEGDPCPRFGAFCFVVFGGTFQKYICEGSKPL